MFSKICEITLAKSVIWQILEMFVTFILTPVVFIYFSFISLKACDKTNLTCRLPTLANKWFSLFCFFKLPAKGLKEVCSILSFFKLCV